MSTDIANLQAVKDLIAGNPAAQFADGSVDSLPGLDAWQAWCDVDTGAATSEEDKNARIDWPYGPDNLYPQIALGFGPGHRFFNEYGYKESSNFQFAGSVICSLMDIDRTANNEKKNYEDFANRLGELFFDIACHAHDGRLIIGDAYFRNENPFVHSSRAQVKANFVGYTAVFILPWGITE